MIYCNLKGGLGNMMFQIAASKSFAIDNKTECCFPNLHPHLSYLNTDSVYNPELKHTNEYLQIFKNLKSEQYVRGKTITFPFEYVAINVGDDCIIDGFFQSEKYFKHNRQEILKLFNFEFINGQISRKYSNLLNNKLTSIHVRRGDYVNHPNHHPTQSIEYYDAAIEMVKNVTDIFVIFSDDINWCKANFTHLENVHFVENELDYIEIYLMSKCTNNIISNSSFSWWGAWLNENQEKIVIGPSKWFGSAIQHNTGDILPENWIKI